jgi:hypothetical protein
VCKRLFLFCSGKNHSIPSNPLLASFSKETSEINCWQGFQLIIISICRLTDNRDFLKILAPCGFGLIAKTQKNINIFCLNQKAAKFVGVNKTLKKQL